MSSSQAHTRTHTYIHTSIFSLSHGKWSWLINWEGTSLWSYCKHSKNVKTKHEERSPIKKQLESYYSTNTDHVWSTSDIYMEDLQWRQYMHHCCHSYTGLEGHILYHSPLALKAISSIIYMITVSFTTSPLRCTAIQSLHFPTVLWTWLVWFQIRQPWKWHEIIFYREV